MLDGLVAGYHFDEGRGTTVNDFSDHGRNGTLHGGVTWVHGRATPQGPGHALRFDGKPETYVDTHYQMPKTDFTVAFWYNPASLSAYGSRPFGAGDGSDGQHGLDISLSWGDRLSCFFRNNGHGGDIYGRPPALGAWEFMAVTVSSAQGAICYRNGAPAGSNAEVRSISRGGLTAKLGGSGDLRADQFFDGEIGEFAIFSTVLSAQDISTLYHSGQGVRVDRAWATTRGLALGYHFDEGEGTTVADFSGHGSDGTLHGGVEWVPGNAAPESPPPGDFSHALEFDGTGYATLPRSVKFTAHDFTVSLWFEPTTAKNVEALGKQPASVIPAEDNEDATAEPFDAPEGQQPSKRGQPWFPPAPAQAGTGSPAARPSTRGKPWLHSAAAKKSQWLFMRGFDWQDKLGDIGMRILAQAETWTFMRTRAVIASGSSVGTSPNRVSAAPSG
jgi:hypothetical protein